MLPVTVLIEIVKLPADTVAARVPLTKVEPTKAWIAVSTAAFAVICAVCATPAAAIACLTELGETLTI